MFSPSKFIASAVGAIAFAGTIGLAVPANASVTPPGPVAVAPPVAPVVPKVPVVPKLPVPLPTVPRLPGLPGQCGTCGTGIGLGLGIRPGLPGLGQCGTCGTGLIRLPIYHPRLHLPRIPVLGDCGCGVQGIAYPYQITDAYQVTLAGISYYEVSNPWLYQYGGPRELLVNPLDGLCYTPRLGLGRPSLFAPRGLEGLRSIR